MVSIITPFTVCKRFKIQLLALSLVVSIHNTFTPSHKSLHWLPVNYQINFKICFITRCAQSLHESHYLSYLFSLRLNSHSLRSYSFSPLLLLFFNKKSHGFRSFSYAAHHLESPTYNNVLTAPTYMSFRKNLKTYLFNQAFPTYRLYPYLI